MPNVPLSADLWIYFLAPREGKEFHGCDVFENFVVIASSEDKARSLVPCADECESGRDAAPHARTPCVWHDPNVTSCEVIGRAAEAQASGIVSESFRAG